jgi:hypothetical protein
MHWQRAVMRCDSSATSTREAVTTFFTPRRTSWSQRRAHAYPRGIITKAAGEPLQRMREGQLRAAAATHPPRRSLVKCPPSGSLASLVEIVACKGARGCGDGVHTPLLCTVRAA